MAMVYSRTAASFNLPAFPRYVVDQCFVEFPASVKTNTRSSTKKDLCILTTSTVSQS